MSLISLERFLKVKIDVIFIWGGGQRLSFMNQFLPSTMGTLSCQACQEKLFLSALSPQPKKCEIM